jgi:DUF4097 and DUF4098 domain-containing protein YvlB
MSTTAKKRGLSRTMLVVIILVVVVGAVVAASLFIGPSLAVTKKSFTPYQSSVSQNSGNPSSMTVSNTNGGIVVSSWSQTYLMINGTVTARGFGTSPDAITFVESNSSGNIVFQVVFPSSSILLGASYTVDVHVYIPASAKYNQAQIVTVNGDIVISGISASSLTLTDTNGAITASGISATTMAATDTNGSVVITCTSCGGATVTTTNGSVTMTLSTLLGGTYTVTSTNGNVNLTLPVIASCKITPNTTNGTVSAASNLGVTLTNHTTTTMGTGSATVNLTTVNGSITVTGQ